MSELSQDDLARFSKLFAALDEVGRKHLMAHVTKRSARANEVICREGESGTEFFVIVRGSVQVSGDDLGDSRALATLTAGQFFGEVAVLSGQKRQATVTALEPVELLCFSSVAVNQVLAAAPEVRAALQKVGLQRTEDAMQKLMS
jgi:CRP-like cAMP-binding protein